MVLKTKCLSTSQFDYLFLSVSWSNCFSNFRVFSSRGRVSGHGRTTLYPGDKERYSYNGNLVGTGGQTKENERYVSVCISHY